MKYVYLLRSLKRSEKTYVGLTNNPDHRLLSHNAAKSLYTAKYAPWKIVVSVQFENDLNATAFETYLKSGSGYAFAKRHFW